MENLINKKKDEYYDPNKHSDYMLVEKYNEFKNEIKNGILAPISTEHEIRVKAG